MGFIHTSASHGDKIRRAEIQRSSTYPLCAKKQKLPCTLAEGSLSIQFLSGLYGFNDHIFKQNLKRHGMAASFVGNEKLAIAFKNTVIVGNMVFAIIAVEIKVKLIEVEAVSILSVPFCFFDLAYQSRIHCINLLF
jgi:hypothetical protein